MKEDIKQITDIKELQRLYIELNVITEDLEERINKAIEYIKENIEGNYFKRYDDDIYRACNDLKEILKGEDNE